MLFSFAITTAFIPGVIGLASNTSWSVMWLIAPLLLLNCKVEPTLINILGLMFLSYAALTLLWSPHGLLEFMQLLALASVFVWGLSLKDLKWATVGLSLGLAVSAIISILQYFKFETSIFSGGVAGLFINSNIYAEISGMILLLILIHKLWWLIPVTIPGLLVSSRAVILGFAVVVFIKVFEKSKLMVCSLLLALLVAISVTDFNTTSIYQRLNIWRDTLSGLTVFGHGIGSFVYIFPEYNQHLDASVSLAEYAHNDLVQLLFELGIGTIPLVLIVMLLLKVSHDYKAVLIFFIVISLFGFPLHSPVTAFMVAIVAAQLAKLSLGYRATINSRRPILFARLEPT